MPESHTVLLVSNHAEIVGGGELSLLSLVEALDRSRWAPAVVVPSEGPVAAGCRVLGIPAYVVSMPSLRPPRLTAIRGVATLRRMTLETRATLLHANGSRAMLYAGLAGLLARVPVIWHVRVADPDPGLDRILLRMAAGVVVNSKAVLRRFPPVSAGKVRCIYNGVDLARFCPRSPSAQLRASLGLPYGVAVVASVGRFVPYKGFAVLLEAADVVRASRPDVHWLLVGDGELRGELERQCRTLSLDTQVRFTGWRTDVADLLALADLFVLPSMSEHFGRVLVEAMALGKPVVATDAGGVPEIVVPGETGLLVPPGDATAMARAICALLKDPARSAQLGAAGRRRVEAEFSLARHVAAVEALYAELLDAGPSAV